MRRVDRGQAVVATDCRFAVSPMAASDGLGGTSLAEELIAVTNDGLFCRAGGFHIDPWNPVPRAVVTHAHADHARWGCTHYLAADTGRLLLRTRLGDIAEISTVPYGEPVHLGGVRVSFHPAGHV